MKHTLLFIKKVRYEIFDDDHDDDEFFLWYGWPTKLVYPYFQARLLSEILSIANLQHVTSRIWTCAEPNFQFWENWGLQKSWNFASCTIFASLSWKNVIFYYGGNERLFFLIFTIKLLSTAVTYFTAHSTLNFARKFL